MEQPCRQRLLIEGAVQGVGFRPYVARLARRLQLTGWVCNTPQGSCIEVEGPEERLRQFRHGLTTDLPAPALVQRVDCLPLLPQGDRTFVIRASHTQGQPAASILPDLATCGDCLRELFDAQDRRYHYPFINCTRCGPRFSILLALPYDRHHTTMRHFPMCAACQSEYDTPQDRRFHAQPNACPQCGPHLTLWNARGEPLAERHAALLAAVAALRQGAIVAVKGIGGFHLMVRAQDPLAVQRLRQRKQRLDKPFAVLYPSLQAIREDCQITEAEAATLLSPAAPIVFLAKRRPHHDTVIAPANPYLGVMLPANPVHHLLMDGLQGPLVATSGNRAGEPLCIAEEEVVERLGGLADLFLVHNRPIVRPLDDSLVQFVLGQETLVRRARGYAPAPVVPGGVPDAAILPSIVAVGGHLKNTVAITVGQAVVLSQHLGDLHTPAALQAFQHTLSALPALYKRAPALVACDTHPDYLSTRQALSLGVPVVRVQHHYAHVLACMAEHSVTPPALGIAWDGTGYGPDGTIWGGEFLVVTPATFQRQACLKPFPLPGGEAAIREPRRAALGLLYGLYGEDLWTMPHLGLLHMFQEPELRTLRTMLQRRLNTPLTSSIGRLFDAVASLLGLCHNSTFEGQAAMALEFAQGAPASLYPFCLQRHTTVWQVDWAPMLRALLQDLWSHGSLASIAATFHHTLVAIIVHVAQATGLERVMLSGGCFQNRTLIERAVRQLQAAGFVPFWPCQVPCNDGGLAFGQVVAAWRTLQEKPLCAWQFPAKSSQ